MEANNCKLSVNYTLNKQNSIYIIITVRKRKVKRNTKKKQGSTLCKVILGAYHKCMRIFYNA